MAGRSSADVEALRAELAAAAEAGARSEDRAAAGALEARGLKQQQQDAVERARLAEEVSFPRPRIASQAATYGVARPLDKEFLKIWTTFGDTCQQNASKNDPNFSERSLG